MHKIILIGDILSNHATISDAPQRSGVVCGHCASRLRHPRHVRGIVLLLSRRLHSEVCAVIAVA